jgi:hypothetical protein
VEEHKIYAGHRKDYLKRSCFTAWFVMMPKLKMEKLEHQASQDSIVSRFRYVMHYDKKLIL